MNYTIISTGVKKYILGHLPLSRPAVGPRFKCFLENEQHAILLIAGLSTRVTLPVRLLALRVCCACGGRGLHDRLREERKRKRELEEERLEEEETKRRGKVSTSTRNETVQESTAASEGGKAAKETPTKAETKISESGDKVSEREVGYDEVLKLLCRREFRVTIRVRMASARLNLRLLIARCDESTGTGFISSPTPIRSNCSFPRRVMACPG